MATDDTFREPPSDTFTPASSGLPFGIAEGPAGPPPPPEFVPPPPRPRPPHPGIGFAILWLILFVVVSQGTALVGVVGAGVVRYLSVPDRQAFLDVIRSPDFAESPEFAVVV